MFQIGDKVVHPIYGAGTIKSIEERQDRENRLQYYVIPDTIEADRLLVPIDTASNGSLRKAISSQDAEEILRVVNSEAHALASQRVDRIAYLKKVDWNDPFAIAELWRDLSSEAKNGKLSAETEKVRRRARRLLLSELCIATGMSSSECSELIDNLGDQG